MRKIAKLRSLLPTPSQTVIIVSVITKLLCILGHFELHYREKESNWSFIAHFLTKR